MPWPASLVSSDALEGRRVHVIARRRAVCYDTVSEHGTGALGHAALDGLKSVISSSDEPNSCRRRNEMFYGIHIAGVTDQLTSDWN